MTTANETHQPHPPKQELIVFLCYRRADGQKAAQFVYDALISGDRTIEVDGQVQSIKPYYDIHKAPVSDWRALHLPTLKVAKAFVLVLTAGVRSDVSEPGKPDWVHQEINWWLKHRKTAPIIIDTTGDGERWLPQQIKQRWAVSARD